MEENNNNKFEPKAVFKHRLFFPIVSALVILIFGMGIGAKAFGKSKKPVFEKEVTVDSIALKELLLPSSDLVSMKYTYTDVAVYENSKKAFGVKIPLTTDKVIFTYSGIVSAGINLSDVTFDINDTNKTINITLPSPQFMSHEMDETSFKFYDAKNSIFTETKLEDYTSLMSELKSQKEEQLRNDADYFASVSENAQNVIKDLLNVAEATSDYEIVFK